MQNVKTYVENGIEIKVYPLMGRPHKHRVEPTASQEPSDLPKHIVGRSWRELTKAKLKKRKKADLYAKSIAYKLKKDKI
jgi:hypothetical protein